MAIEPIRLNVNNASFSYGKEIVFENLTLELNSGDILFVLGPNGVGKTTLFKTIMGFLKSDSGTFLFNDQNIKSWKPDKIAKNIAYVPQSHTPPFPFKVKDVVLMGRTVHLERFSSPGVNDLRIADEAMKELGICHLREKSYTDISGGERQLVLIARALCQEASLLIMDEPTSNLDFGNQIRVYKQIQKLANKGIGIILSSHVPNHALHFATHVALMNHNTISRIASPEELITSASIKELYEVDAKIFVIPGGMKSRSRKVCIPDEF